MERVVPLGVTCRSYARRILSIRLLGYLRGYLRAVGP